MWPCPFGQPTGVMAFRGSLGSSCRASVHVRLCARRAGGAKYAGVVHDGAEGGKIGKMAGAPRANSRATRTAKSPAEPPPRGAPGRRGGGARRGASARARAARGWGQGAGARWRMGDASAAAAGGDILSGQQPQRRTTAGWLCPCPVLV